MCAVRSDSGERSKRDKNCEKGVHALTQWCSTLLCGLLFGCRYHWSEELQLGIGHPERLRASEGGTIRPHLVIEIELAKVGGSRAGHAVR